MKVVSNVFPKYLQKFSEADALYNSLYQQVADFALSGVLDDEDWESLKARMSEAKQIRNHYAVVLCRVLSDYKYFESVPADAPADAPEDAPADVSENVPEDASEDAPVDVSENALADVPEDAPEDAPVDVSEDALADVPEDAPEDVSADVPENVPEDFPVDIFPVMSAKCKLCPSCVDGRCFFVPDIYDSVFPCQSPAWDDFFKNGGSRSPAPRARASPL